MSFQLQTMFGFGLKSAAFAAAIAMAAPAAYAQADGGAFAQMAGSWSGTGQIKMSTGASERIRCNMTYAVDHDGANMRQTLRCASDSYKFDLNSDVVQNGNSLSGIWSETTRGVGGNISGQISGGQIQARAESATLTALLNINTRGNAQTVSIRSPGSDVSEVTISLNRRSR